MPLLLLGSLLWRRFMYPPEKRRFRDYAKTFLFALLILVLLFGVSGS